jgi:cytochrome c biogenesis protein ResB
LLKVFIPRGRVVRVCCLILHVTLIIFLNCVIIDDCLYCGLSQWSGNYQ